VADNSDALFRALADPTRRRILDLLAERGILTVSELAAEFPDLVVSGISKHLMSLRAAGLVAAVRRGRHQVYEVDAKALAAVLTPWIAKYEQYWSEALARLRDLAEGRGGRNRNDSRKSIRRAARK
jgi:DNA-binding transcriptional ArsR family regulator